MAEAEPTKTSAPLRVTPLALIAAFLSLTELIAGYSILHTDGNIQLILTVFVVSFPVAICAAFFYILAFRNYTLFAPHEYSAPDHISTFVNAMRGQPRPAENRSEPYAAHALMGVFDALYEEVPSVLESLELKRKQFTVEDHTLDGRFFKSSVVVTAPGLLGTFQKLTVGSLDRETACVDFPFLHPKFSREKTRKVVQALALTAKSVYFRIGLNGDILGFSAADNVEALAALPKIPSDVRDYVLHVQYTQNVNRDLVIIFGLHEELAQAGTSAAAQLARGLSAVDMPLSESALVISDEGDIFGTVSDARGRDRPSAHKDPHR